MAGNKTVISADLENVGQGERLPKIIISWFLYDRFQPTFHQNDAIRAGNKSVTSAGRKNVGQVHISQRVMSQLLLNRFEQNFLHVCRPSFLYPR